jgi:hypothetical protein
VTIPHPGLVAAVIVVLSLPAVIWIAGRVSHALARYDARERQRTFERVSRVVETSDAEIDAVDLIEFLVQDEIAVIRAILDDRQDGQQATSDHVATLRYVHRRGLAVRQRCGDPALEAELGWLQGYGSYALMADLSELDRAAFDRDLDHRAAELQRALSLRRVRIDILQT